MVSILFNICNGKITYIEIIGVFSKIQIFYDYALEKNKLQRERIWSMAMDASTDIFIINQNSSDKPTGLYESIVIDGYF